MERYALIHPERALRRAVIAVAVSVGVHALLLGLLVAWALAAVAAARREEAVQPKMVTMARLEPAQWEKNRTVGKTYVPSAALDTPAADLARPEQARFLADRDRRAERETVAPPKPGMPGRAASPTGEQGRAPASTPAAPPSKGAEAVAMVTPEEGIGPRPGGEKLDLEPRPPPQPEARPLVMNFDVAGEGGIPDIDGVAVGNLTVLNAEAWRYATFFDRVGTTLYGVWRVDFLPRPPVPSIAARPRGGTVRIAYGVTLDARGRAVEVTVRRSCGLKDVDELLGELIRRSAPFPNVPPGLLDASGHYSDIWVIGLVWGWRQR